MRSRTMAVAAAVTLAVVVAGAAVLRGTEGPARRRSPAAGARVMAGTRVVTPLGGSSPSLLYLKRGSLRAVELETGRKRSLGELRADVAAAAPRGPWIAEVVPLEAPTGGERDFVLEPELRLLDVSSGRESTIGPGFAPLWGPDGATLVFLEPTGARRCSGEVCQGKSKLVALDVATGEKRVLLDAGRWGLLSWLGRHVVVSDARNLDRALSVSLDGRMQELSLEPSEVWAGSPDGEWLVAVQGGRALVHAASDGATTGRPGRIPIRGGILAAGAWAPDSSLVAAVVVGGGSGERAVIFDPEDRRPARLRGLDGATGPVLWSDDGRLLAAPRGVGGKQHVAVCTVQRRSCRPLLPYGPDMSLVGIAGG
jgi:hypothetical protein